MRYYIGVDWADAEHAVWVADEEGQRVSASMVLHSGQNEAPHPRSRRTTSSRDQENCSRRRRDDGGEAARTPHEAFPAFPVPESIGEAAPRSTAERLTRCLASFDARRRP